MTQNSNEVPVRTISQAEVTLAESQEQEELNASQKAYLQQRVVTLRVQNNRLQAECDQLKAQIETLTAVPAEEGGSDEGSIPA